MILEISVIKRVFHVYMHNLETNLDKMGGHCQTFFDRYPSAEGQFREVAWKNQIEKAKWKLVHFFLSGKGGTRDEACLLPFPVKPGGLEDVNPI